MMFPHQFHEANVKEKNKLTSSIQLYFSITHWIKPRQGFVKANFEETIFKDDGASSIGVVIRDYQGNFLVELSKEDKGGHQM